MKKKFYVYLHIRNDTNQVFYVGKGHGARAYSSRNRNKFWKNIASKGYRVEFLKEFLTDEESCQLEMDTIKSFKTSGESLTNMTEGGDGRSGYKWTPDQIKKRTQSVLGTSRANKGTKWTKSQKETLSKTMTGRLHRDSKKVIDSKSGKVYNSAKDASLDLGLPWGSVYKMLKGERVNKTTLSYME